MKIPHLVKNFFALPAINWILIFYFCSIVTVFGATGDTQSNPIVAGNFSTAFNYSNSQNTINFTNAYTTRTPNDVYYKFTLNKKMEVTISHCGSTLSDTYISLLNDSGNLIAYNDDYSGTGACSSTLHSYLKKELDAGTYYVVSEGYSQNGVVLTSISGSLIYMQGDSFLDPINVGVFGSSFKYSDTQNTSNFTNSYTVRSPNDVFYKFTLTSKMLVIMTHCGSSLTDTFMSLLDASGNLIASNDDYSGDGRCSETSSLWSFIQQTLDPGTYYIVSEGYSTSGNLTTNITGYTSEEFGYPDIPNSYSSEPEPVGSLSGNLNVSSTGAATYTIPIDMPLGVGGMQPSLSITYNSLVGNGLAGWGTNLSGLSVITRAPKNIYYDGEAKALTHLADEAYYLDGQRLIYDSGIVGQDGAVYHMESDPFTKIIVHGMYDLSTADTWFEVRLSNGLKYFYGSTAGARQAYTYNNSPRINAWYLDYIEDPLGNYINYTYNNYNYFICPNTISYGKNKNETNSLQNIITFEYEYRSNDPQPFVLEESIRGSMDYRLKTIISKTGNEVYRSYGFVYDITSDGTETKFSRLTTITEKNGAGEMMKPVKLNWSFLPTFSQYNSNPTVNLATSNSIVTFTSNQQFSSADLNGDGIPDIIGVVPVKILTGTNTWNYNTYSYVYWGALDVYGNIQYTSNTQYELGASFKLGNWTERKEAPSVIDFDGDGLNDLLVPNISIIDNINYKSVAFVFACGTLKTITNPNKKGVTCTLKYSSEMPVYSTGDFNNDGKGDVVFIEKGHSANKYPCSIFGLNQGETLYSATLDLTLPSKPEKIFVSDYNSDGLTDLLVFYSGGYTIFWNQGKGISSSTFSDTKKTSGTNIANVWKIFEGDFNGDGLSDFLLNSTGENTWYFALNNGNGTFYKTTACTLNIYDHNFTEKDDDKFTCLVYDFNMDGKSDVIIHKAMYTKKSDLSGSWGEFSKTYTYWMRSTGGSLIQASVASSNREEDGYAYRYFVGDFNGDGQSELMNYGYNCYNSTDSNVNPIWRLYKNSSFSPNTGKVISVVDGYGATTSINYASLVNGGLYTKGTGGIYPIADYTIPFHAVKTIIAENGSAGALVSNYQYKGLKVHLQGKGILGMESQTVSNTTMGTVTESGVKTWNASFFIPSQSYTKTTVDGATAETIVSMAIVDKEFKKYFAYPSSKIEKDLDGNIVTTTYEVNTDYGYPESEMADYGNGMNKTIQYTDYVFSGGSYRPQLITRTQKHTDDSTPFTKKTHVTYDLEKGWKKQIIDNYKSVLPVTTSYTYDSWGNVLSSASSGDGIISVTKYTEYDNTKRFPKKVYTSPASAVNTYTYDTWGNVLTENDETNPSYVLSTTHTYDNWGSRTSTTTPSRLKTTYAKGWNGKADKRYFTLEQGTGKPWIKTWYDNRGREVLVESVGEKSMSVKQITSYNSKGQVAQKQSQTGNLAQTDNFIYDARGRLSSQSNSLGQSSSFSYGNRTTTVVTNGRTYIKTYDAWGGIKSSVDPVSDVTYIYTSGGSPKSVTSGGAVYSMTYDNVGNQLTLTDPNAGTSTYTYDAAGRVTKQVDGRGIVTDNIYDNFGRLFTSTVNGITLTNYYGTSGNEALHLVKKQVGNNYVEYTYNEFGQIRKEVRQVDGVGLFNFEYGYTTGRITDAFYPADMHFHTEYDAYGNKTKVTTNGLAQPIWELKGSTGTVSTSLLGGTLTATETRNAQGLLTNLKMEKGAQLLHNMNFSFEGATGNLSSRSGMFSQTENFTYDNLDRLTDVLIGGSNNMHLDYLPNGNISGKTGIGSYSYGSKPHAVTQVENTGGLISSSNQTTSFNEFNKIGTIMDSGNGYNLDLTYGPDQERWKTVLKQNGNVIKTAIFAGDYEQITENGVTRRLYYLDGGAIYVKQDGKADKVYYTCTDHLGSVMKLVETDGTEVFAANYDAWGKQTVTNNTFAFHRGYTGHEHLPEFSLINMNGRLYDPVIGRFLSPDPYVQMPDFSQNFNRYSYCVNNPLKFTDPSGELFGIDDAIIFAVVSSAVMNGIQSGAMAEMNGGNFWSGALKGAAIGAASAALPFGIGQAFGHTLGTLGHELLRAGAHGLGNGLLNVADGGSFGVGFLTGATASIVGSGAQELNFGNMGVLGSTTLAGGLTAGLSGGDWMMGAMQGMNIGAFNHTYEGERPINAGNPIQLKEVVVTGRRINMSTRGSAIAALALSYVGRDMRAYGLDNNPIHIDCSRFTREVAAKYGYELPRTAKEQMEWFKKNGYWSTDFSNARNGDNIFWSNPNHTGIVVFDGNGKPGVVNATVYRYRPGSIRLTPLDLNGNLLPRNAWPHHFIGIGRF
ncbi:MAG TPA: FG-GAP-like repeat-containing protein [Macellibacteroides fermentans]|uniref:FG-GAP-like repeat-containing protein n=1 Tax=Macellibacteroides fermentans TaxID=879969 RepID=UPI002BF4546D|nr:FG-GAP-like repeat-containing protein [Macellibacteroides fermentans]